MAGAAPQSFGPCIICNATIWLPDINSHLDKECGKSKPKPTLSKLAVPDSAAELRRRSIGKKSSLAALFGSKAAHTPRQDRTGLAADASTPKIGSASSGLGSLPRKRPRDEIEIDVDITGDNHESSPRTEGVPLAERMRPRRIEEFIGQANIMGPEGLLSQILRQTGQKRLPSVILYGPPGVGKTTIARMLGGLMPESAFVKISACTANLAKVREVITRAQQQWTFHKRPTILFVDEIHRFNKLQQDAFLPYIENGTVTFIGATTENPSFEVNSAVLSRCKVLVLEQLTQEQTKSVIRQALSDCDRGLGALRVDMSDDVVAYVAMVADGDARVALNLLELAVELATAAAAAAAPADQSSQSSNGVSVTLDDCKRALQRTHVLFDKTGEEHYNVISALHKSMRGSDADAALYWLGRQLEGGEKPLYIARRLIRFACEDVGLADPSALLQANACFQACHQIGMPECDVVLAQCVVYLARAPKSIEIYRGLSEVREAIKREPNAPVPLHIRNAPTKLMKQLDYGKGYKYNPEFAEPVQQTYLPDALVGRRFLEPDPRNNRDTDTGNRAGPSTLSSPLGLSLSSPGPGAPPKSGLGGRISSAFGSDCMPAPGRQKSP